MRTVVKSAVISMQCLLMQKCPIHPLYYLIVFSSPLVLQATALNSTIMKAQWTALPNAAVTVSTSSLTGYVLFYKETTAKRYQKIGVAPSELLKTLDELKKFTEYRMGVCAYSENGNGVPSAPVTKATLEDGIVSFLMHIFTIA